MRTGSVHACFFFNWDFIAGGEAFADDDVAALLDKKDLDDNDDEHEHDDDYGVDKLWNSVNNWLCVLRPCLFLLCFCVCSFQPLQYFFFVRSFFLFFLSLLSLFLRLLLIPPHQIQSTPQGINRSSDSHTHIRKINSHSRLLKVKISSGVVFWGLQSWVLQRQLSVHTVLYSFAHCSMQASSFYLSAVSHWWWHE